jgi:hypothetical protein
VLGRTTPFSGSAKYSTESPALAQSRQGCCMTLLDSDKTCCSTCYPRFRADKDRRNIEKALTVKAAMQAAGHDPAHGNHAALKRGSTNRTQQQRNLEWEETNNSPMTKLEYRDLVLPRTGDLPFRTIMDALGISKGYASTAKKGEVVPHSRLRDNLSNLLVSHYDTKA